MKPEIIIKQSEFGKMPDATKNALGEVAKTVFENQCQHKWIGDICTSCGIAYHIWIEREVKQLRDKLDQVKSKSDYFLQDNQILKRELERVCNKLAACEKELAKAAELAQDLGATRYERDQAQAACEKWKAELKKANHEYTVVSGDRLKREIRTYNAEKACAEMREALLKWKAYFQKDIPMNADQQEQQGEEFTEAWFDAEKALSTTSGQHYFHADELKPTIELLRWMDRKGGLGLDVHNMLRDHIDRLKALREKCK